MFVRIITTIFVIFFLAGCATTSSYYSNHKPDEFNKITNPKYFEIKYPVTSSRKAESWAEVDSTQGILPGVYVSALENGSGTLYFGSGHSYFVTYSNKDDYYLREGGFWIPKDEQKMPKLFYIVNINKVLTVKSIEEAIKGNAKENLLVNDGLSHLGQPANNVEGIAYGIAGAIVNTFIQSEHGNIVLVPTEEGYKEKLSAELHPVKKGVR